MINRPRNGVKKKESFSLKPRQFSSIKSEKSVIFAERSLFNQKLAHNSRLLIYQ